MQTDEFEDALILDDISIDSIAVKDDIVVSIGITVDASTTDDPDVAVMSVIEAIQIQDDAYEIVGEGNILSIDLFYFWNLSYLSKCCDYLCSECVTKQSSIYNGTIWSTFNCWTCLNYSSYENGHSGD